MENALSLEHHEFVCGEFFVRGPDFDTLILHNERGVFMQVRIAGVPGLHRDFWLPVCRGCGALLPEGTNYDCTSCIVEGLRLHLQGAGLMDGVQMIGATCKNCDYFYGGSDFRKLLGPLKLYACNSCGLSAGFDPTYKRRD